MPFEFANRSIPTMRPGGPGFDSERSRGVGGKSLLRNTVALRLSQRDFKGSQHDGAGEDWPIDYARKATRTIAGNGRPPCHFCGNWMAGCDVAAKYNSYDAHMKPALKTGKLEKLHNSVVREVVVSAENRANGVRFVNRETNVEGGAKARCVVVSCATVQSVALLLMSQNTPVSDRLGKLQRAFGPRLHSTFYGRRAGLFDRTYREALDQ